MISSLRNFWLLKKENFIAIKRQILYYTTSLMNETLAIWHWTFMWQREEQHRAEKTKYCINELK